MRTVYRIGVFAKRVGRSVVHTFSGRLDGLRRYEKELAGADLTVGDDR
ncbi:hypothetical protein ONA91_36295 [Micromonospora sp. DR5-3]|nr:MULTISPECIES: hypothetical protein [unclassified Micromonospora]MCW3819912.1 hypothetical protein [Micromonospora sp. DR5-3]